MGWGLSVLFFQVTCGHSVALILTSWILPAGVVVVLVGIGRDQRKKKVFD
jgi:ferrous iron transport protein B